MTTCTSDTVANIWPIIRRKRDGYYTLQVLHAHTNGDTVCDVKDLYDKLDLGEMLDVLAVCVGTLFSDQLTFAWEQRDDGTTY